MSRAIPDPPATPALPLSGRRVVELVERSAATHYAGRVLAELGADVLLIEPPEGAPIRRRGPFVGEVPGRERGAAHLYFNAGKRTLTLDLDRAADRDTLRSELRGASILLESLAARRREDLGLGGEAVAALNPALVHVTVTGFGTTGPRRHWHSSDLVASATGGAAHLVGEATDPPVRLAGSQADVSASIVAVSGALMALHHATRTGCGQHVDVSAQEAVASLAHICGIAKYLDDGIAPKRRGSSLFASVPSGAYACSDGLVYLIVNRPLHWDALARWIAETSGNTDVLDPMFRGASANRIEHRELLDLWIGELAARYTAAAFVSEAAERRLAVTPVHTALEVLADEQLASRDFWRDIEHPELGGLRMAGSPFRHATEIAGAPRAASVLAPPGARDTARPAARPRPLDGIRVVELTAGMAGPWIGRWMAWAGAEVIRIESRAHPDVVRLYVPPRAADRSPRPDRSPWFTDWNAGKRFVSLDLAKPGARALVKRLVARSDVVIENMLPEVAGKLGVRYADLAAERVDLVMLSTTGFGGTGPQAGTPTWGPNIEAVSGLAALSGFAHVPCSITQFAYPDALSALHGLVAVLAALDRRARTGRGGHVDLAQYECLVAALGDVMLDASRSGREPERRGNRAVHAAPHGVFRCAGDERWCAIAVESDGDWNGLVEALGAPAWARDPSFSTAAGRVAHADEIEAWLGAWTSARDGFEVAESLQAAGVPAGVVSTIRDLAEHDPQLRARGFFERVPHRSLGHVTASAIPLHLGLTPGRTDFAGGLVGADNDYVLREILRLDDRSIAEAIASGAVEALAAVDTA
ncbi:MAG: CoA transferase [bacterium]